MSMSDFDPLSPANLQRASDPWYGNTLLSPSSEPPQTPQSHPVAQKVFIEDALDEEWGEFENFGVKQPDSPSRTRRSITEYDADDLAHHGWSQLQQEHSEGEDEDEEVTNDYAGGYAPRPYESRSISSRDLARANEPPSFTKSLLARLASFGSTSNIDRRGSVSSQASSSLPLRSYDSYDVTFAKGPIGLELETDWYGRQAVVKGFKQIKNEDGVAKTCGVIRVGDVLTAINGESCLELSFQETLAKLRTVSKGRHTLHFKSLEAAGDLGIYNQDTDIIQAKKFIHQHKEKFYRPPAPLPNKQLVNGCVERLVGETVTAFNFHREDTGEFLLACSCLNEKTGVFVFHTLQDSHLRGFRDLPQSEDSAVYLGQMVPNFLGTEFTLLDHQQKRRNEIGFIEYSTNVLGRVPNFLKVAFPKQRTLEETENEDEQGSPTRPRAVTVGATGMGRNNAIFNTHSNMMDRNGTISDRYKRLKQTRQIPLVERLRSFSLDDIEVNFDTGGSKFRSGWHDDDDHAAHARAMRLKQLRSAAARHTSTPYGAVEQEDYDCDLLVFETRKPSWNEELGAWTLNFNGRVKLPSKKNFLIVAEEGNENMEAEFGEQTSYLRFGKVSKTRFSLDFQAPITPFIALAIATSAFARKMAVT
ncbi:hypothetical protein Poli38472_011798 [Pythium oligandrum]|uniref:PDZ domain-containing protein n=1 Tax=Pythium oligandrum TaxID=41045 RepID=A0A8K1C842_PYTOL|nr:hypothetical protein Poli38472_011798 [Pythium oligandrum]|eukprot:TMW58210.1 hypothetical protein Poli38472_011798 [Pythium oligandrum]